MHYIFIALLLAFADPAPPEDLIDKEIIIRNIKSPKGIFIISVYNDAAGFPKVGKEEQINKVMVNDTLPHSIKIHVSSEGWYAIAMFQDEDVTGKIKQDKIGVPEEAYGFSNNIHPRVEAPGFAACKFYISKQDTKPLEINLIQPRFHGKL